MQHSKTVTEFTEHRKSQNVLLYLYLSIELDRLEMTVTIWFF